MRTLIVSFVSCVTLGGLWGAGSKLPTQNPFRSDLVKTFQKNLQEPGLKIYFSGNVDGLRDSCGCALNPKGGLERRYNFLKKEGLFDKSAQTQKDDVLVVDFGNLFFKSEKVLPQDKKLAIESAQKLAEASNKFGYTAINLGMLDRVLSNKELESVYSRLRVPLLASNIFPSGRFASAIRRRVPVKLKNTDAVLFGLSSFNEGLLAEGWRFEDPSTALLKELSDLSDQTLPIVLSDLEMSELLEIAPKIKRPIVFIGSRESGGWERPMEIGQALLLHIRHQGQDWGVVRINTKALSGKNTKTAWFNPVEADTLANRWDYLRLEESSLRNMASSDNKTEEVKSLKSRFEEVFARAPNMNDTAYTFEAVEMGSNYDGKNEMTSLVK